MHNCSICLRLIAAIVLAALVVPCAAEEPLRAGIIGTTTSHVPAFTKLINDPKATGPLADVKVVAGFTGGMRDNWMIGCRETASLSSRPGR